VISKSNGWTTASRFSRTPALLRRPPPQVGEHTDEVLREWGIPENT